LVGLAAPGPVQLVVYDLLGQRVRRLVDGNLPGGRHQVSWDGRDDAGRTLATGVYVTRVQTAAGVRSRKVLLLR
jgi:serine protease